MALVRDGRRLGVEFGSGKESNHEALVCVLRAASVLGN